MLDYEYARQKMVDTHIARRGVRDERVLDAMREVPREVFVEEGFEEFAYEDSPLPISEGQTISQPLVVAHMIEAAEIEPADRVLEVGTGSGYAAAVMSRVAAEVFSIERHATLSEMARRRVEALGYRNVTMKIGDGSEGWPEQAPFDAILVAAGGPTLPPALKEQLEIGGRLVMPVGREPRNQRLVRVTRVAANRFEDEDLGGVMFVPLIGAQGWQPDLTVPPRPVHPISLPEQIAAAAEDLPRIDDPAFAETFDRFGDRRVVLLGEASHGTSEFYRARAAITRRLVEKHGFEIVAVEADWPDAAIVNRIARGLSPAPDGHPPFQRFPTWMWRNTDVAAFLEWLRAHNEGVGDIPSQVGFYGLDLYNMRGSIAAVLAYLDGADPQAAAIARQRYGCLTPWQNEPSTYGRAVLTSGYRKCEEGVVSQCRELLERSLGQSLHDDGLLDAAQNARLVASAEKYYRIMYYGGAESWNLRDRHMFETLDHLLASAGPSSRAVVWAHNSHVGDARETDMGRLRSELNIGQLCRERFGEAAALIGFGTHSGSVAAASDWDGDMEVKQVRPSLPESHERLCHDSGKSCCLLDFARADDLRQALAEPRLERFIGVIYRSETERLTHYAAAVLPRQFDAFVWFDRTTAVTPLTAFEPDRDAVPLTFPFGY
ncbi:MAG: protein-L-isoaspartate O-methyltransferase [Rhizobiaceae bacterium]|nr:protein-L-isoaspartate O-methyltransferase [Rhizobiaceae bacterium]